MNTTGALSQNLVEVIGALLQAESREEACSVIERRAAQRGYENVIICNSEHASTIATSPTVGSITISTMGFTKTI